MTFAKPMETHYFIPYLGYFLIPSFIDHHNASLCQILPLCIWVSSFIRFFDAQQSKLGCDVKNVVLVIN